MSFPGELLRDNKLPPNFEARILVSTGRSALRLALNYHKRNEFGKMVGPHALNKEHKQACVQLIPRLQGLPFEDTELIGSDTPVTNFEVRVAKHLELEEPDKVKEEVARTTSVLYILGVSGDFDSVDKEALTAGITTLDAVAKSLVEIYPIELPPMVRAFE